MNSYEQKYKLKIENKIIIQDQPLKQANRQKKYPQNTNLIQTAFIIPGGSGSTHKRNATSVKASYITLTLLVMSLFDFE